MRKAYGPGGSGAKFLVLGILNMYPQAWTTVWLHIQALQSPIRSGMEVQYPSHHHPVPPSVKLRFCLPQYPFDVTLPTPDMCAYSFNHGFC